MKKATIQKILIASTVTVVAACEPHNTESETSTGTVDPVPSQAEMSAQLDDSMALIPEDPRVAVVKIEPRSGSNVSGELEVTQHDNLLVMRGEISGLSSGPHGFHIHENGDCSANDASSAGGHFSPTGSPHGAPTEPASEHHAGDLGNIVASQNGTAVVEIMSTRLRLEEGTRGILGRSVIVHSGVDDLVSQPSGDAGDRLGCGIIEEKQNGQM